MASLYNISNDIANLFNEIENAEGEITDEMYDALCIKKEELSVKLDDYVKAIKEYQKDADFCKKEKVTINDRQNIFKNRVERLKKAVLKAVIEFGEQGKTNKFIECPTYRVFTRTSKSVEVDEKRVFILLNAFKDFIKEVVHEDCMFTGSEVDYEGILASINANVIAELGESFKPFTLSDLYNLTVDIKTTVSVRDLFNGDHDNVIKEYVNNAGFTCIMCDNISKDEIKKYYEYGDKSELTIANIMNKENLQIK